MLLVALYDAIHEMYGNHNTGGVSVENDATPTSSRLARRKWDASSIVAHLGAKHAGFRRSCSAGARAPVP